METEVTLAFADNRWIALHENHCYRADSLAGLERKIEQHIRQSPRFNHCKEVHVCMRFDYDSMPVWLRQYHSHYFNRIFTVSME